MPPIRLALVGLLSLVGCAQAPGSQEFRPDCHRQAAQADGPNVAASCMVVNNYIIGGTATASPPINVQLPNGLPGAGGLPLPLAAEPNAESAAPPSAPGISGASITAPMSLSGRAAMTVKRGARPLIIAAPADIWAQSTFRFTHDAAGHLITEPLRAPP